VVVLRLLLVTLQLSCLLQNELLLRFGKCGVERLKVGLVGRFISVSLGLIGRVKHLQEVLVLTQVFLDEALEKTTLSKLLTDPCRVIIDLEHVKRVALVERVGNHMGNVHQAGVGLGLLGSELDLVESLLEKIGIDTVLAHVFESGEKHIFDFLEIVCFNTLHTNRESSLPRRVVKTGSRAELRCELRLNDSLIKGRVRSMKQQRAQDLQAESLVSVLSRNKITEEGQGKFGLLVRRRHQIRHEALLFVDKLVTLVLKQEQGVDRIVALEVWRNHLTLDKLEMLGEVQITIGEELRVRGVIVLLVEVYELLILQIGDEFGLTA